MAVKVPLLVRNCQLGLEKTTASPVRSHLEIISHLLPVHLAAYVSLALSKRLCRKEKHPCPSGATYVSSSSSSASSSAFVASAGSAVVWSCACVCEAGATFPL